MSDDIQVIQALCLSADEIVQNEIHFTDMEAKIISINKVALAGRKQCMELLEQFKNEPTLPEKPWWKFW